MSSRILLTGSNGYIGSHILSQLLDKGIHVCCPVRNPAKADNILQDFASHASRISISIVPDIVTPGAYDQTLQTHSDLEIVIHTASPFFSGKAANNLEFLDPAIKGTTGLLRSIKLHAPSVKRVVYTSSSAAVVDYDLLTSDPPKIYTEQDWNPITWDEAVHGDQQKAYRASKKFAELAARKFVTDEAPNFDLVTLCPPATFGPLRHTIHRIDELNESNARLWRNCFATTRDNPVTYIPVHTYVDVRDLAAAHVNAALTPEVGGERFLVFARQFHFQEICDLLRANFPELADRTPMGKPGTSSLPSGAYNCSNEKVRKLLGVEFRPLRQTIIDGATQMLDVERREKQVSKGQGK